METPKVDEMIKSLEWQIENSFTTQRNIDLLSELKAMKQALNIHNVRKCCNVDCSDKTTGKSPYCEFHASM